jgi:hypothetical protein
MNSRARFSLLLVLTTLVEGLRAGAGTFRLLLDLPARHDMGPVAFAAFSRATDLSTRGVAFYVVYGFGGALLTGVTWRAAKQAGVDRPIRLLLASACVSSLLVLVLTIQAAPLMWGVGGSHDPAALSDLLDRFTFWTTLRIGLVVLSFLAVLSALGMLAGKNGGSASQPPPQASAAVSKSVLQ